MPTEWLKVMLDEIARKREDARQAHHELAARASAREPLPPGVAGAEPPPRIGPPPTAVRRGTTG